MGLEAITASEELISTNGFLTNINDVKKFAKKNSGKNAEGKLNRCTITNASGSKLNASINLVCWGEYAELVTQFEKGGQIILADVKAKQNKFSQTIELHTTGSTRMLAGKEKTKLGAQTAQRQIIELKENENLEIYFRIT